MKLEVAEVTELVEGRRLMGFIHGDVRNKFPDNTFVTTSAVDKVLGNKVRTRSGSEYEVEFVPMTEWVIKVSEIR